MESIFSLHIHSINYDLVVCGVAKSIDAQYVSLAINRITKVIGQMRIISGLILAIIVLLSACSSSVDLIVQQDQNHWIVLNFDEAKLKGEYKGINGYALEISLKN